MIGLSPSGERSGYSLEGLLYATLHSLRIADPEVFHALPEAVRLGHLAHVRNEIGGRYLGESSSGPSRPSRGRRRGGLDMMALMNDIHRHRTASPSPRAVQMARRLVETPGLPPALLNDARETLRRAGGDL